ncbi:hypothetical protein M885DRAFT_75243 [Pelagophyceae sp. CCMP2097]|nr:hypothetical protein M885DRAFT_75243 [Pelagophyceae sp. CCMP2097]
MRQRRADEVSEQKLLDEEEQEKLVEDLRQDAASIDRFARRVFCALNVSCAVLVACACAAAANAPRSLEGVDYFLEHQRFFAEDSRWRFVAAHLFTVVEMLCSAKVCAGGAAVWTRRTAVIAALVPGALWTHTLYRHGASMAAWWLVFAAPLSCAVSAYIDRDMAGLDPELDALNALRYDHKTA